MQIRPLPPGVSESEADACYDHFEKIIAELGARSPAQMAVDMTRGTKAMSAAALLAPAFRHRVAQVRDVESERDPANPGVVPPGSERVGGIHAEAAFEHRALDGAYLLFRSGGFATAWLLLGSLSQGEAVQTLGDVAGFYSAWDRLDYKSADGGRIGPEVPAGWTSCAPSARVRRWVHRLAQPVPDRAAADCSYLMAARLRLLIADLQADGGRRLRQHEFEHAALRVYRVFEMRGQARLFDRGLDSARLPPDHEAIRQLRVHLIKRKGSGGDSASTRAGRSAPAGKSRLGFSSARAIRGLRSFSSSTGAVRCASRAGMRAFSFAATRLSARAIRSPSMHCTRSCAGSCVGIAPSSRRIRRWLGSPTFPRERSRPFFDK